jgi:mRNA-degrading endonuclease toxin of MazEF toxin-antitoxin module
VEPYPHRGEIWWIETPNQPYDPHTPRPALIISENVRNRNKDDCLVVPIFSSGNLGPTRVAMRAGEGGLEHDSVAFCDEICCLDHDLLDFSRGPLGQVVSDELLEEVVIKVRRAIGEVVPLQKGEVYPRSSLPPGPEGESGM